jgi:hypothetical protein
MLPDEIEESGDNGAAEDAAPSLDDIIANAQEGKSDDDTEQENQEPDPEADENQDADSDEEDDESSEDDNNEGDELPSGWTDEDKGVFEALEPDAKELVLSAGKQFQADYTRKTQDLSKTANGLADVQTVIDKHSDMIALAGVSPAQAINTLLAAQSVLENDSVKGINYLMKTYGVKPEDLGGEVAGDEGAEFVLPGMDKIMDRLDRIEGTQNASSTAAQNQGRDEANSAIKMFEKAKDDDTGKLLHPHFTDEKVRRMVGTFLGNQQAEDMDEAYNMAVRTLELTSSKVKKKTAPSKGKTNQEKVAQAKKAGKNPKQRSEDSGGTITNIDEAISAALTEHGVTKAA